MADDKRDGFGVDDFEDDQLSFDSVENDEYQADEGEYYDDAGVNDYQGDEEYYDEGEASQQPSYDTADSADQEDLNSYATEGDYPEEDYEPIYEEQYYEEEPPEKKLGFFARRREKKEKKRRSKKPDFDESEEEYYGIQLKPIDEYRKGYDQVTGEFVIGEDAYASLFDDSKKAIDDEVEKNFEQLRKERRSRVAEAVQTAGMDESEIADELGIVAPMPVSSYDADPYTRQHGVGVEGQAENEIPEFQKAQLDSISKHEQTMEIKLNVLNDTVELQKVADAVSDETVEKVLEGVPEDIPEEMDDMEDIGSGVPMSNDTAEINVVDDDSLESGATAEFVPGEISDGMQESESGKTIEFEPPTVAMQQQNEDIIEGRPVPEIPQVTAAHEYRAKGVPTHIINTDVLQSALLSEAQEIEEKAQDNGKKRMRVRKKSADSEFDDYEASPQEEQELISDYTGPEDAKSISNELRSDMRELTMRLMITGVSTVVLALINLIFGNTMKTADEIGAAPAIYIILTLIFVMLPAVFCRKSILGGLKALFMFNANSDSGVAIATAGVLVQTIAALFFTQELAHGTLHLYAVVLTAMLFVNVAGKLTMIRRIHSNFRFVASREKKYAVRNYNDYNTALKMTKDAVAEKPLIAFQSPAGFLKRFLELSYRPDPTEISSQAITPIGLILSLVVCIASLLITGSVPAAISSLTAALIASVAVGNMLAINLPISRLTKTARRAGAMIVGYEAVDELGSSNAVIVDATDIFPRGTVVINGIKTYGHRTVVQDAIMAASAIVNEVGGPLTGVFEQVINDREDSLPEVESYDYEEGNGIIGRVDGCKIYIGNRDLLINHRLNPPAREDEMQYANGNREVVYIAQDAEIIAMIIVTYSADRKRKNELQRLEDNGVTVLVRTTDSNVTASMISKLFEIDINSVVILDGQLAEVAQGLTNREVPRSDALVATKGRVESMMNVISLCIGSKRQTNLIVALQTIAVVLGFLLVAFLACFSAIKQLTAFSLFLFELVCLLVIILVPKFKKF